MAVLPSEYPTWSSPTLLAPTCPLGNVSKACRLMGCLERAVQQDSTLILAEEHVRLLERHSVDFRCRHVE